MADTIRPVPDSPNTDKNESIATPEGDNEFAPDQPLKPVPDGALENPRGAEPDDAYKNDRV